MAVLLISSNLQEKEGWHKCAWTKEMLPDNFELFDFIIIDFTKLDELGQIQWVYNDLYNKVESALEDSPKTLIAICGDRNNELFHYDPNNDPKYLEEDIVNDSENQEDPIIIKTYDIFSFLDDRITIKNLPDDEFLKKKKN